MTATGLGLKTTYFLNEYLIQTCVKTCGQTFSVTGHSHYYKIFVLPEDGIHGRIIFLQILFLPLIVYRQFQLTLLPKDRDPHTEIQHQ